MVLHKTSGWLRRCSRILAVLLLLVALSYSQSAQTSSNLVTEYDVKAAFLLNFIRFVDWPTTDREDFPAAICILGKDPFGLTLDRMVEGERLNNRPITVKRIEGRDPSCRAIFVPASNPDTRAVLGSIGRGVLTVGESPDFLINGGMINFLVADRKVRFDVSAKNAERASLRLSSRLLSVARVVMK